MCSDVGCLLQMDDERKMAALVRTLSEDGTIDLLASIMPPALILFDVCATLGFDATKVLGIRMLMRIKAYEACRPWPTLTEAEDAEMVELAGIRKPVKPDEIALISGGGGKPVYDAANFWHWSKLT